MGKKFTLFCTAIGLAVASYGQEIAGQQSNGNMNVASRNPYGGYFEIVQKNGAGVTEHINVNYALAGAPFTKVVTLKLHTAQPTPFTADVTDMAGKKLLHWAPQQQSYVYDADIDISKLAVGKYKLVVYTGTQPLPLHTIEFSKENATRN